MFSFNDSRELLNEISTLLDEAPDSLAAMLLLAASDMAIVTDESGIVEKTVCANASLDMVSTASWAKRPIQSLVTRESVEKVEMLLADAGASRPVRWRQVNHPLAHAADLPVQYAAIRFDDRGRILFIGRELRAAAAMQRRLLDAQQALEVDFERYRAANRRFRILFHSVGEPLMLVDHETMEIVDANEAALAQLEPVSGQLIGARIGDSVASDLMRQVADLVQRVAARGRSDRTTAMTDDPGESVDISAEIFATAGTPTVLVRISGGGRIEMATTDRRIIDFVESSPDAAVITSRQGEIRYANGAFHTLVGIDAEENLADQFLQRWALTNWPDLSVLDPRLLRGPVRNFAAEVMDEFGERHQVELSLVSFESDVEPMFGFQFREILHRSTAPEEDRRRYSEGKDFAALVGELPLKDIVRRTTEQIEATCIITALEMTRNNRASAAELLGVSRQSLYVKLRRLGLEDDRG